jgi:undecaprenyl-diphosphatase
MAWDFQLLHFLNSWTNHNVFFDQISVFFADYLVYFFIATLALYFFFGKPKIVARTALIQAFASFVLCRLVLVEIIREVWPRMRPFDLGLIAKPIVDMAPKVSAAAFPSGHASAMFAIAAAVYFYDKKLGKWFLIMASFTAVFRVVIGVHYPTDVLAGAILGILTAYIVHWFFEGFLLKKHFIEFLLQPQIPEQKYESWQRKIKKSEIWRAVLMSFGVYSIYAFVAAGLYVVKYVPIVFFMAAFAVIFSRVFLCSVVNAVIRRARPYQKYGFTPPSSFLFTRPNNNHDSFPSQAGVAELAYAHDSKSCEITLMWVQLPPPAPEKNF